MGVLRTTKLTLKWLIALKSRWNDKSRIGSMHAESWQLDNLLMIIGFERAFFNVTKEGRGAMVSVAWHFAYVATCRVVQTPLGAGFSKKYPLSMSGHCFDVVSFRQGTLLSHASLDSGVNDTCLIRQRRQCLYDKFNAPQWLQDCMLCVELKWSLKTNQWPGVNVQSADKSSDMISDNKPLPF